MSNPLRSRDAKNVFKRIAKKLFGQGRSSESSEGFFLNVRCGVCGEEFRLFIHWSTDLTQEFDDAGGLSYLLKKEIIGSQCRNRIRVRMEFDGARKLLAKEIENGAFIDAPSR
jgi:hypothetical protein